MDIKLQLQLSKNLRALRKLEEISQAKLARTLGIGRSSYTQYEIGDRLPDLVTIIDISRYYHVNTDTLIYGDVISLTREYFMEKNRSKDETTLLRIYSGLSDSSKARLMERAEILREADEARKKLYAEFDLPFRQK